MHGFLLEQDLYPDIFYRLLTDELHSFGNIRYYPIGIKTELFEIYIIKIHLIILFFQNSFSFRIFQNNYHSSLTKLHISFSTKLL